MQKQAPSAGRILVAVGFALSCFGLLLFLWVTFGGPVPLSPKSYRITADFPEATTLAIEADVRIGGVNVGKVKSLELAPEGVEVNGQDATRVTIEIHPEFAPIASDARAILRQKTLLGETFVELTSGSEPGELSAPVSLGAASNVSDAEAAGVESIPEDGQLANTQVQDATQIDEIFNALDEETRRSFQRWQANAAVAIQDRGPRCQRRLRQPWPVHHRRVRGRRAAQPAEGGPAGRRSGHRRRLRGPDRTRRPTGRRDR